jgi:hypothetical protein
MGLGIFPCDANKQPLTPNGFYDASIDESTISKWWKRFPDALPAIWPGISGLVVIDLDVKNGHNGPDAFEKLCNQLNIDQSHFMSVQTPSKGYHLWFRSDIGFGNAHSLPSGIDLRSMSGFVLAPGAPGYEIVAGDWDSVPALPDALVRYLTRYDSSNVPKLPIVTAARPAASERERQYAENALADECAMLASTKSLRNAALNTSALHLGEMVSAGWIDRNAVESALWEASATYRAKDGDNAAWKTLQSGLQSGMANPRAPLPVMRVEQAYYDAAKRWIEAYKTKHLIRATVKRPVGLLPFSNVQPKFIEWLWRGYLPKGKLTLLAAIGGVGKSTISCDWASTVSTAGQWPDGSHCEAAGNVLIWSSEDDPNDTIAPRLIAAGADLSRCHFIQGPKDENAVGRSFDPATDMNELRQAVAQLNGVSLFIIDPLINAVTGDMNKANDVRRGLQSIVDFASEMNCAVLGISHFGKNTQGRQSSERILGSAAFKDFSRTALVAVQDEATGDCAMARAKTNLASNMGGFAYRIEPGTIACGIETIRIVWGEALEGSARSILGRFEVDEKEDGEKLKDAKQFLIEMLSNGPAPAKELLEHARQSRGLTEITIRRAAEALSIKPRKLAMNGGWVWEFPFSAPGNQSTANQ